MLKDIRQLQAPDVRYVEAFRCSLEELHADMSSFELPASVPANIRQCHDAIRHAYIYSYFSYDLLTVAAAQSLPCLELALRLRIGHLWNGRTDAKGKPLKPKLHNLLEEAKKLGLVRHRTNGLNQLRNIFAHGSDSTLDPNMFLSLFGEVTQLIAELFEPEKVA